MELGEDTSLEFRSRILGREAADRLRCGGVTQTIRSRREASKFFMRRGSHVKVLLDGKFLYPARIIEISVKPLRSLDVFDAEIGGFTVLSELHAALKRAGFRFKPLQDYVDTFAVGFLPVKEVSET